MRFLALLCVVVVACTPDSKGTSSATGSSSASTTARATAPTSKCERFGQTCEVSPGKLGTCVQIDDCPAPPCFACQNQH